LYRERHEGSRVTKVEGRNEGKSTRSTQTTNVVIPLQGSRLYARVVRRET
jgi:hypothetical protein